MKAGKQSFYVDNPVYIRSAYTIVGPKEGESNFDGCFDLVLKNDLWGEKSFEKAESKMHREAIRGAVCLAGLNFDEIDMMLAGDLLNEISASSLAMRYFQVPFVGLYNACSTFSESILLGSALIDAGCARTVTCSTSSHFASAERQYRYPLELGNQRTPTSQWTVTGAGCTVLTANRPTREEDKRARESFEEKLVSMRTENMSNGVCGSEKEQEKGSEEANGKKIKHSNISEGAAKSAKTPFSFRKKEDDRVAPQCDKFYERTRLAKITGGTFGKVVDLGIKDESNMGGAMAPAAADTFFAHLEDTKSSPSDYDAIFTGDLGRFGKEAFEYILSKEGIKLCGTYTDCGASYFKPEQKTFQGGSGAGCVNTVFNGYILKKLENGTLRKVLVLATGALLNKDTPLQKETIPGISHAFVVETEDF